MRRALSVVFLVLFAVAGVVLSLLGLALVLGAVIAGIEGRWDEVVLNGIAAFLFGGGGLLMVWLVVRGMRGRGRFERAASRHPDEPWRWRPEWAGGRIRSSGISSVPLWTVWIIVVVVNAMAWPVAALVPAEVADGNHLALAALGFPLAAIGVVAFAIRLTLRRRRYGRSWLLLETLPGRIGGELRGEVQVPRGLAAGETMDLSLVCVHREIDRHAGGEERVHEDVLWRCAERTSIAGGARAGAATARVVFAIPPDLPPSSPRPGDDVIAWRIEAHASVAGVDYAATFAVPVFRRRGPPTLESGAAD